MWVLKLGGSLYGSDELARWARALVPQGLPLVVVPGGGPFADRVRAAQRRWEIDDLHAHAMALLAMEQMGLLLCSLDQRLVPCDSSDSIRVAAHNGQVAVWMPTRQVLAQRAIVADWTVTSDSLALWLARDLDAKGVALIKSADLPAGTVSIVAMQRQGIVDQGLMHFAQRLACSIKLVHRSFSGSLRELFEGTAGCRLTLAQQD